jgi:hypothetical protein
MAFTTDTWKGTASADWGASRSNWSTGLPNSNSNVEIATTAVLTVTYSGSDTFVVNSLTVGNDIFDMTGGSLTITTTASFANGFTQTGGTLTAGGKVTVKGTGTLTGGVAEGKTAFVFDGTVALGNYTLGGATSLKNEKTTNLTSSITLGDTTGVNATIDNEKGGFFNIGGDFGVAQGPGAATALFVNAGELEKSGGTETSFIGVDFTDTGSIVVATAGTIEFGGPQNSFAGTISGAGQVYLGSGSKDAINKGTAITAAIFTISDNNTLATLNENLALAHAFNLQNGATLDLASVTLTLSGSNTFENATLDGIGTLVTAKSSTTDVSFFTLGGSVVWQNFGTVGEAGTLTLGDNTFHAATFINEKGGKYELTNDNGISIGTGAFGSLFVNLGTIEATAGSGTSQIFAEVTDTSAVVVHSGTIEFLGFANSFAGAISGAGTFEIGGSGVNLIEKGATIKTPVFDITNSALVTLGETLSYGGTFNFTGGDLSLGGVSLTLSGKDTFSNNATFDGTGTLVTAKGSAVALSTVVLGGAVDWQNSGRISESSTLQIGDGSLDVPEFVNMKGGILNFTTDVGITLGAPPTAPTLSFVNSAGATVAKTGGTGDSEISVDFINNGAVVVDTGEIQFQALVSGAGTFTIEPGTVLQFDGSVAKGSTVDFASKKGGELSLLDSQGFDAAIKGFGGSKTDEIYLNDINFNSGAFHMTYKPSKTEGVLTVTDGTHTAKLEFFGKYTGANFHASSLNGGTLIVDPASHALLASAR